MSRREFLASLVALPAAVKAAAAGVVVTVTAPPSMRLLQEVHVHNGRRIYYNIITAVNNGIASGKFDRALRSKFGTPRR